MTRTATLSSPFAAPANPSGCIAHGLIAQFYYHLTEIYRSSDFEQSSVRDRECWQEVRNPTLAVGRHSELVASKAIFCLRSMREHRVCARVPTKPTGFDVCRHFISDAAVFIFPRKRLCAPSIRLACPCARQEESTHRYYLSKLKSAGLGNPVRLNWYKWAPPEPYAPFKAPLSAWCGALECCMHTLKVPNRRQKKDPGAPNHILPRGPRLRLICA